MSGETTIIQSTIVRLAGKWRRMAWACLGVCVISSWTTNAVAQQFSISNAKTELIGDVYHLGANLKYEFSAPVLNALDGGMALTLVLDIEVYLPSRYLWDGVVASLEQRYEISYHALSNQYLLRNANSGSQFYYSTLDTALATLSEIKQLPIIDSYLLEDNRHYMVRVKSRLDLEGLPAPLRLKAYISQEWWLSSGWHSWDL